MTYLDGAGAIAAWHGARTDDAFLDWVLWERTAFPACDWDTTARQLDEYLADPQAAEIRFHEWEVRQLEMSQ